MSATTAQILIGRPHPNDGGIHPTYALYLHEGDRCAWSMHAMDFEKSLLQKIALWSCDPNQMMEDAILLTAFHASGDEGFRTKFLSVFPSVKQNHVDSFQIPDAERQKLLNLAMTLPMPKMVVSIFRGSGLKQNSQTDLLASYPFEWEICESVST